MRGPGYLIPASALLALGALGALVAEDVPGVVRLDLREQRNVAPASRKRANRTVEEVITNEKQRGGYFSTCKVGTPGQEVILLLDTGSSDTWIPAANAPICSTRYSVEPCPLGSFDHEKSTTYEDFLPGALEISYMDGTHVRGDYFHDTLEIGNSIIHNLTMGIGLDTSLIHGVVGIGYMVNEASVSTAKIQYDNLPVALAKANATRSIAYSIWLNDLGSRMGSILFGGVDVEKYVGTMMSLNVTPAAGTDVYDHFRIPLTSIQATSPSGSDTLTTETFPVQIVLDSGTTLSSLPEDIVNQMWQVAGAEYSTTLKEPLIPCYRRNSPGNFTFGFGGPGGPKVTTPMNELVLDITLGQPPLFPDGSRYQGQEACMFGIHHFGGPPYILGGTFLRSAYVAFDIVNNQVGMAQTDFNETKSHILAFSSSGAPIPSATAAPNQGQTDTPSGGREPDYVAADGFQNGGWALRALPMPTVLAVAFALWAVTF